MNLLERGRNGGLQERGKGAGSLPDDDDGVLPWMGGRRHCLAAKGEVQASGCHRQATRLERNNGA